jgi:hypothetical protein
MLGLDLNAGYVVSALGITVVVLGGYVLLLRSRLTGARRGAYSARNVSAAAPIPTTAQPASSAKGPSAP